MFLWNKGVDYYDEVGGRAPLLIKPEEIAFEVFTDEYLAVDGLTVEQQKAVLATLSQKAEQNELVISEMDIYDWKDFFKEFGATDVDYAAEWTPIEKNAIFFYPENIEFVEMNSLEPRKFYDWWDGSNWRHETLEEYMTETEVEITDDYVSLDEWDGRNWQTGGLTHQYVYKVVKVDGKEVGDMYLLRCSTQYQDDHDTAEVLDKDDLVIHLEKLGRNVTEYMYQIGKLAGE